ncbi:MAG: ShlB/FhaC/HecB family hemolysin secretion/activation protein [Gammaproteobacteria bacterium]|jgi:hemolysin activation/secretion protein
MKYITTIRSLLVFVLSAGAGCFVNTNAIAGMLDMPDVRDSTPLKGKSVYENIDIPAVRERDPNPETSPRVWVLKIKLQGVVERPEYGIIKEDIERYAEDLRAAVMKEEELLEYGYTLEDLAEVADLMVDIDAGREPEQVTEPDVQRLIFLVRDLKERRGLTLIDIENIATKLTNYYRERGFFLTKVYVPKQEVRRGVVVLTVLEGKLGKVTVADNQRYDADFLKSAFDDLMYRPVTEKEIEQTLYLMNDYPGLDVYGYFKAGDQVGDTWLNLQVREESLWSSVVRYDNHGSELTGEQRFYVEGQFHNPLSLADNVSFGVLKTFSPDKATYGIFRYRLPVYSEEYHLGLNFSRNQFATVLGDLNSFELVGDTSIAELTFDYTHIRRKEKNWVTSFAYARKDSDLKDNETGALDLSDLVEIYKLGMNYDSLDTQSKVLNQARGAIIQGEVLETAEQSAVDKTFTKVTADYSFLTFLTVPWFEAKSRLIFKSSLQYSGNTLPPVEQYSLAGPNRVRAFEVTQFSGDSGVYIGADWIFNMPGFMDFSISDTTQFSNVVQPFLFVDYGYGLLNEITAGGDSTGELSGYGFGLQLNYRNEISGNLQIAFPLDAKFSQEAIEEPEDELRVIMDVQYLFN